ncbi:hypothetical protein [Paraflavitalea pollutisoli]|uniref:hypothetical protein n=1 Tax=Paraflavitalea pollutisoli TaxID=3034143 RepID=UPI0023EACD24|nr:hypothetical protein [Paraflavitalea sp. H1-2-19X]
MNNTTTPPYTFSTDWLASDPVFYNTVSGKASHNIHEVIDYSNIDFHPEGLKNYLRFGYSVFEQTPVKNVKFLPHSAHLQSTAGQLSVIRDKDVAEQFIAGPEIDEKQVLEALRASIQEWEQSTTGNIVIPTSGGFDSRILNEMIRDKQRIHSYTYGISDNQTSSYEVVFAKKISEILGSNFKQIKIGDFHHYFDAWDSMFGISTHAHGMYQMEFYDKIKADNNAGAPLLSGIIGDAWAGSVKISSIESPGDLFRLGYSHGVHANADECLLQAGDELAGVFYEQNRTKLNDPLFRVVEAMRLKIILLSYLIKVPKQLGFKPWSPFLDPGLALSMLKITAARRKDRAWQVDYFKSRSLYVESLNLKHSKKNTLDRRAMYYVPIRPLDSKILGELFSRNYIDWINKHTAPSNNLRDMLDTMTYYPKVGGILKRMGVKDERLSAYNAYLTLKPIETLLIKRNSAI